MSDSSNRDGRPPPNWPVCSRHDDDGCVGIQIGTTEYCLAHLKNQLPEAFKAFLDSLGPGASLDLRGTQFSSELLRQLLGALTREEQPLTIGSAKFDDAQFSGDAWFNQVQFSGDARFGGAQFSEYAGFDRAQFSGEARFEDVQFSGEAWFGEARFSGSVWFNQACFSQDALFKQAQFTEFAWFGEAQFIRDARFEGAQFSGSASFGKAQFSGDACFDEGEFSGGAGFKGAQFNGDALFKQAQFTEFTWFGEAQFSGDARFEEAQFSGDADFAEAQFSKYAWFNKTQFSGHAWFNKAQFAQDAWFMEARFHAGAGFGEAQFSGPAGFGAARFNGDAWFEHAQFSRDAGFGGAQFSGPARFEKAKFGGPAWFGGAQFSASAGFREVQFAATAVFGPLRAAILFLDGATFGVSVVIEVAARHLSMVETRFEREATLWVRYADVLLDRGSFAKPSSLAFAENPSLPSPASTGEPVSQESQRQPREPSPDRLTLDEAFLRQADRSPRPRLLSLRRVDVTNLVLGDVDLTWCLFRGALNLDKLRIEGPKYFAATPKGRRWTHRRTLAEERLWRSQNRRQHEDEAGWLSRQSRAASTWRMRWREIRYPDEDWHLPSRDALDWVVRQSGEPVQTADPDHVAPLYRALRKAEEDAKYEPGAADFYYGEMEMRRHADNTPWVEKRLLWAYWLVSGYGLRGLRALISLLVVVLGLAMLFQWVGFRGDPPAPWYWGSVLYAAKSTLSLPVQEPLTSWGEVLRILLRLTGPVLLGLALLSVRGRVKR